MDKELQRLLEEARSRGASTQQLDDILARYNSKKKEQPEEPFQFGVSDTESLSPSQETKEPTEEVAVEEEPQGFGFYFENNPVNKLIKKVPVVSEIYTGIESLIGSTFKNAEMMLKENVPQYLISNPVYRVAEQALMANTTVDEKLAGFYGAVGDVFMEDSKKGTEGILKTYGLSNDEISKGVVGNIIEGNVGAGATILASSVLQQIPQLAAMAAAGPVAGASLLGASASGSKYAEIQDDETLSSGEKALYSLALGVAEGAAEYMFKTDVSQLRRVFGNKQTLDEFRDILTKELKKETLLKSTLEEGGEEFIVGVTDLLIESALKGDVDNWDREAVLELADQTLIGSTMGGSIHALTRGVNSIGSTKNERDIADAKKDISDLVKKRENATPEEAKVIDELIQERVGDLITKQGDDIEFYKKFSEQDRQELIGINKEIREAAKKYNSAEGETLKSKYKKQVDDLRARKQELENKYSEEKVRYIKDGKEFSKGEFVEMINKATPEEIATGQWGVENDTEVEQLLLSKLPQDDSKKEERVPSTEQKEEAPKQAEPIQEGGVEAPPTGGVVQEAKQLTLSDGTAVQEGIQVVAKNPVDGSDIQGTIILEGDPDNPRVSVETETDIVELGTSEDINPADIKPFTAAVAEAETLTANEDGTLTYNKEGNPTIAKGTNLTIDTDKGLAAVSVFSEGKFVPLTEDADREKGLRVQMVNQDGETVQLYGQDALDATYNIMLAMNEAETQQLNKLLDNEETINAIAEAEESARKDSKPSEEAKRPAVKEARAEEDALDLDIILLDEQGGEKELTSTGGTDPRNIQTGKMTVVYGEDGLTFKTDSDTGRMKRKGGEMFIPYSRIETMPNINKYEKGTKEYAYYVAGMESIADPYEGDPVELLKSRLIKPEDLGKKGTRTENRFSEEDGKRIASMISNFNKLSKKFGKTPTEIVFGNSLDIKQYYRYLTGEEKRSSTKGTYSILFDTIFINTSSADISTVAHELTHAYIQAVKLDQKKIVEFTNILESELAKGTSNEVKLSKELGRFRDEYVNRKTYGEKTKDDPIVAEEFLAEYVGRVFKFSEDLSPSNQVSFVEKLRKAVIKFLAKLGVVDKNLVAKIKTREEALNFINGFVNVLQGRVDPTADTGVEVEEQGESGEVGTISVPKQQIEVIDAPKASEDPRDFVRKFVTDVNIKELSDRKFVTNMYDYTNAGLTALGNGLSINLLGGRNYVPLMMSLNGKELGEVSNLAAFNTKAQAEGFIRNAKEGKSDLFAPHSGTLTDSWQFQHHIFEELVNLVLDNKIMSKARLMETFNEAIKSKEGAKAFQAFNEKNKSRLKNLNSFKKDPMKLVELLNAENNYSPNLRKALNQKLAASKDFQQAIGIKNLNQFYNLIADPLNEGVSGGEIMTFVEFDPKTFEVVKPKPTDADFHPSFAWAVKAKIKRILQPNKYYKSYDLTKEYTKYNVSGPETSTKEDPKFAVSNVMSSAGAIPKVAKVDVAREQIDFTGSETLNEFSFTTTAYKDGKYRKVTSTEKSDKPVAIKFPDGVVAVVRSRKDELAEAKQFLKDVRKGIYPYADVNFAENKVNILEGISEGTDFHVDLFNKNGNIIGGIKLANDHYNYYGPEIGKQLGEDYKNGLIYSPDNRITTDAVYIDREFQGKGYGARLYHSALRLLRVNKPGARLVSNKDTNISKKAKNFWRGHLNQGLAKVVLNTATPKEIEEIGGPEILRQLKEIGAEYTGDIYELLDPTEAVKPERKYDIPSRPQERQQIDWQFSEFGRDKVNSTIITRGQFLQQAAQDLLEGKITNEEYKETAKIVSEIDPIAKFFLPASNDDMKNALGKAKSKKLNVQLEDGEYVGLRLDIPAYVNSNIWVVTAHKGTGAPLTYGSVAWATDVKFGTNPKVAAFISAGKNYDLVGRYRIDEVEVDGKTVYKFFDTKTGKYYAEKGVDLTKNSYNEAGRYRADRLEKQDKSTIGKMLGKWKNFEGKTKEEKDASAIKKVEEIVKIESSYPGAARKGSPWRQIGMNPFRHSYFYDRRNGKPVVGAAEVVQVGGLVYAKDVEYADWSDDQFTVNGYYDADGQPVRFQLDSDELTKIKDKAYAEIEKGKLSPPLYKKTWYQSAYNYLFRTELESKILKLQEKKGSRIEESKKQGREIAARIKKYAKTPEALKLANEYLVSENKKDAKEAILKLPKGQQLLNNLRSARAFIDNISNELVNDPAFDGLDDELRLAIQDNLSTYLRTQYRFFTDKKYNIDKRRKPAIDAQANQLLAQEIGLLSAMGLSPLDISTEIAKRQDDIRNEAEQMIDGYISDLKYVKYQPSKGGAGIKMPSAAFKRKKELPEYIEQLLGKEKDPIKKFSQTSEALANILYKGRMIDGIIDIVGENSDYILDVEPRSPKDKQYTKVNDPYSKLNGKWVHNEVMDMVNQKSLYSSERWQWYYSLVRLSRKSKVIWNFPSSYRKNLTGGWFFVLTNGIINPKFPVDFARRTKRMFNVRGEKFQVDEETIRLASILADKGVSGASIDANLIGFSQATYQFGLDGDEGAYVERLKKVFNITSDSLSAVDSWLQEKYSSIDDYTKLIIFRSEIQTYAKKLYGKEYSELNEAQQDNVHEEAAERVKQSTPTFSRLPKWFNKIAAVPVVAPFISFTMESIRSYSMNVANGALDIKKSQDSGLNDVQKKAYLQAGLRRLSGAGAALALRYAIVKLMTQWFLDDEDEELADDARALRPDWMSGHSIIPRSIDKDGNVKVYNYSTEDPYNDISNILQGPGSWGELVGGFVGPDIAADVIMNIVKNKDIYGGSIADYSDSKINQTLDLLMYGVDKIAIPPTLSSSFREAWLNSDLPASEKSIEFFKTLGERSIIRDYKYNIISTFYQDISKISETRKTYEDYKNPTKRLRQLDDIRKQYDAIVAIAVAKDNYDLIRKAERALNNLDEVDREYVYEENR